MKNMILTAVTVSTLLVGACAQASPEYTYQHASAAAGEGNGATFVHVVGTSGYYVVAPGSAAIDTLGLQDAPYRDSDNVARNGVGSDAIAFRFGADGRMEGSPVYIGSAPDSFYTSRLASLAGHRTTLADARALFPSCALHVEKQGAQTLAYIEVPVYDPLASGD